MFLDLKFSPSLVPHGDCYSDAKEKTSQQNVPSDEVVSGTLVLQKHEGLVEENLQIVLSFPGGNLADSLLPFFDAAEENHMPISRFCNATKRRYFD